jgi:CxxC motif-containing protein
MKELTCIVCPVGCHLKVDQELHVTGNKCPRGLNYAITEMTNPKRVLTTTVKTAYMSIPRLSVKTKDPIPKAMIKDIMSQLNNVIVINDVKIGDVIVANILDTGVDIVATKSVHNQTHEGDTL